MSVDILYTLFYLLFCGCVIYPPTEFITAGLTIQIVFASFLGSEDEQFTLYHIKRSSLTLFIYSMLPVGYILGLTIFSQDELTLLSLLNKSFFWKIFFTICILLPFTALYQIHLWYQNDWKEHPIIINITKFCNNNSSWRNVAIDIDTEYRRVDKICLQTNPVTKIVATENWIIKINPLVLYVAHQSDASLVVNQADNHEISHQYTSDTQYINIEVKSSRGNVQPFSLRINSLDFKDLQDRVARTITILPTVNFHKTLIDKFVEAFKEAIKNNPVYHTDQQLDQCIGCLQAQPNIKIQKLCEDGISDDNCRTCFCRPMWCVECIAKWFASRQEEEQSSTWLSSKCSCPMCRAKFCILDVCLINTD